MSTDRELLEMAAKAAGLNTPRYVIDGRRLGWAINEGISTESGLTSHRLWNPLTDDGDALRLAVNLEITIMFDHYSVWCEQYGILEKYGGDRLAATRRAIVRAAAEIGRSMK